MLEDLKKHLERVVHEQNKRPLPEFEGYPSSEMHAICILPLKKSVRSASGNWIPVITGKSRYSTKLNTSPS